MHVNKVQYCRAGMNFPYIGHLVGPNYVRLVSVQQVLLPRYGQGIPRGFPNMALVCMS